MYIKEMKVAVVGMGRLGLSIALSVENKGHKVVGVDTNRNIQQIFDSRRVPYQEVGINEFLKETDIELVSLYDAIDFADIVFVSVQTPTTLNYEEEVECDYSFLIKSIENIAKATNDLNKDIILILTSTIPPGTTEKYLKPLFNKHIHYIYEPFLGATGIMLFEIEYPKFILLGTEENKETVNSIKKFWRTITNAPILKVPVKEAEFIKMLYSTYLLNKISFITSAQELCHKMEIDIDMVTKTLTNIDSNYLSGGQASGEQHHLDDVATLSWLAKQNELSFNWFESILLQRENYIKWQADLIEQEARKKDTNQVVMCGMTYKKDSNLLMDSPSLLLKHVLEDRGFKIFEWDPHVYPEHGTMDISILDKKIFIISMNHSEFENLKFDSGSIVVDLWGIIKDQEGVEVIRVGRK